MCAFFTWLFGLRVHTRALVSSGGPFVVFMRRMEGGKRGTGVGLVVLVYMLLGGDGK